MKMLYILNVAKRVNNFSYASMIAAQKCGFDFHIAGNWSYESEEERLNDEMKYGIKIHQIDFVRKPYSFKNKKAYKQLMGLCMKERFDVIHCNTPIGGLLGRLVGSKCKVDTIIYQAHGFHFFKGAPLLNWLIYYPIEKWLSHKTDILVTINNEDYSLAKRKMRVKNGGNVVFIPGVGIDLKEYKRNVALREIKRKEFGLVTSDIAVVSSGDLIRRKNYLLSIKAMSKVRNNNIKLFICGSGPEEKKLKKAIYKLKLQDRVFLLGYRDDIKEILSSMDVFLLSSKQEGIPRSLMEAMAYALPCIATNIRGNNDLLNGISKDYLCSTKDYDSLAKLLDKISDSANLRTMLGKHNFEVISNYDIELIEKSLYSLYKTVG